METIKSYLENVFKGLPKTGEILKLKGELLANMEDKYNELKANGKTENEAVGIVISEFGNIDELLSEMNIHVAKEESIGTTVDLEEAQNYIDVKKTVSHYIGLGVALILMGVATLVGLTQMLDSKLIPSSLSEDARSVFPVIILFLFLVPAISLFIFFGSKLDQFKYIEEGDFTLSTTAHAYLSKDFESVSKSTLPAIIIGVTLCVLSPIPVLIGSLIKEDSSTYGVSILFLMIALAVYIFISFGSGQDAYKKLLNMSDARHAYSKKNDRVLGAIASVVWPLATCIFLFCGLVLNLWYICWIVFPITGILFGGFCACYSILKSSRE